MFKRTFAFRSVNTFSKEFGKIFGKEREGLSSFALTSRVAASCSIEGIAENAKCVFLIKTFLFIFADVFISN